MAKPKAKERIVTINLPPIRIPRAAWAADPDSILDTLTENIRDGVTAKMNGDDEFAQ